MYSRSAYALAEALARSQDLRRQIAASLSYMDRPEVYSGQRLDQTQALAAHLTDAENVAGSARP